MYTTENFPNPKNLTPEQAHAILVNLVIPFLIDKSAEALAKRDERQMKWDNYDYFRQHGQHIAYDRVLHSIAMAIPH